MPSAGDAERMDYAFGKGPSPDGEDDDSSKLDDAIDNVMCKLSSLARLVIACEEQASVVLRSLLTLSSTPTMLT